MHNGSALKLTNSFDQIKYNEVCVMAPFPNVKRFNLIEVLIMLKYSVHLTIKILIL